MPLRRLVSRAAQPCALSRARHDPDAFAAFYDAYASRVLVFFARRVLDAEVALDLTSETFAQALKNRGQFRGRLEEEEQAWLFAIARTQLTRYWRRGRVEREALQRYAVDIPQLTDAELERVERMAGLRDLTPHLLEAIAALPPDQQRAVELRVVEELDYAQVAERMAVSEQVARARVSRGLRAMARDPPDARGVCGDLANTGLLQSSVTFTEPQVRTVVFGRTRPGVTSVLVEGPGRPRDVRVGPAGAFLLLYDGRVAANQVRVTPR